MTSIEGQSSFDQHTPTWTTWGISILNGAVGDYLHRRQNGLATEMAFYHRDRPLAMEPASLRQASATLTAKLCILVHGLGCSEGIWTFQDPAQASRNISYGSLLQAELGYTPFYLRYNTGRSIAENGRSLSLLLRDLVDCYPVPVEEIVLIGHSMGGLVLRSACHYGSEHQQAWVRQVKEVFYLGTPHDGADLEKAAHIATVALRATPNPITRLIGNILNLRSQGVKDLRFGTLLDDEGIDEAQPKHVRSERPAVPWLAHGEHYLVGGTLTKDPQHVASFFLGDALVRMAKIPGPGTQTDENDLPPWADAMLFHGVHHLALARDLAVYQQIKQWCSLE